jgi:hypothetical protein
MITSTIGQRLAGLFLLLLGVGFTAYTWYVALHGESYSDKAAGVFPVIVVAGLGLLLFPVNMEHLRAVHGVDKPQKLAHLPLAWKLLLPVALLAGLGNWLALSQL